GHASIDRRTNARAFNQLRVRGDACAARSSRRTAASVGRADVQPVSDRWALNTGFSNLKIYLQPLANPFNLTAAIVGRFPDAIGAVSSMSRTANPHRGPGRPGLRRWPVVLCAATIVASCQRAGILDPQGPIASAERLLLINSTAIMLVVVIPVIVATLAFAWWYRSSNARASRSLDESYEGRLEFVVWSIPALTVILLGGVIWISSHQLDPRAPIPGK